MFSSIGIPELLVVLVIVLLLFGSKKLPELGSSLGKAIKEFKQGVNAPVQVASESPAPEAIQAEARPSAVVVEQSPISSPETSRA